MIRIFRHRYKKKFLLQIEERGGIDSVRYGKFYRYTLSDKVKKCVDKDINFFDWVETSSLKIANGFFQDSKIIYGGDFRNPINNLLNFIRDNKFGFIGIIPNGSITGEHAGSLVIQGVNEVNGELSFFTLPKLESEDNKDNIKQLKLPIDYINWSSSSVLNNNKFFILKNKKLRVKFLS